jgi:hypothetical protein
MSPIVAARAISCVANVTALMPSIVAALLIALLHVIVQVQGQ